jgi:large exoprotein involved in heme utilization and adhesion
VSNSLISASTETGTAGDVTVNATESVQLSGTGGLSVEATDGGTAGDLIVETGEMTVRDGAQVTVSSPRGQAGNLTIIANSLVLNRGALAAETGKSSAEGGANITLSSLDFLLMSNESLISANALEAANGGNINIDSQFIVALPPQEQKGSDIIANAVRGNGGRVNITTQGLFGIEFRLALTPLNDITASSEFGIAGSVTINQPGVDPSRGLTQLPTDLVDATSLVDRSCTPGEGSLRNSSFTVTGRGGLPPSPDEPLNEEGLLEDLGTPVVVKDGEQERQRRANPPISSPPKQIIEAQGWVRTPDGQIILVAQSPTVTPQTPSFSSLSCHGVQAATD